MGLAAGHTVGPYAIVAPIGAVGMGEVYRARDHRLGRDVALKVLPALASRDPEYLRRFEQEARAAGALNHPNVAAVYDTGTHEGLPYIVSELLEGETLRARMGVGRLPLRKALEYAVQIARGLAAAHEKRVVHRDLKPENLFVTWDGQVKILDFGLAKLAGQEPSIRPSAGASAESDLADKKIIEQKYEEVNRLNQELNRKIRQLTAIQETGKAILSVLDIEELLGVIMNLLSSVCQINRGNHAGQ